MPFTSISFEFNAYFVYKPVTCNLFLKKMKPNQCHVHALLSSAQLQKVVHYFFYENVSMITIEKMHTQGGILCSVTLSIRVINILCYSFNFLSLKWFLFTVIASLELVKDFIFCFLRTCTLHSTHTYHVYWVNISNKYIPISLSLINWTRQKLRNNETFSDLNSLLFMDFVISFCFVLHSSIVWMELLIYKSRWKKSTMLLNKKILQCVCNTPIWLVCHSLRFQSQCVAMSSVVFGVDIGKVGNQK